MKAINILAGLGIIGVDVLFIYGYVWLISRLFNQPLLTIGGIVSVILLIFLGLGLALLSIILWGVGGVIILDD